MNQEDYIIKAKQHDMFYLDELIAVLTEIRQKEGNLSVISESQEDIYHADIIYVESNVLVKGERTVHIR